MQNHSLQLVSLFRYWVFFLSYVYCDSCIAILKFFFFSQFVHWTVSSFLLNNEVPTFTSEKSELLAGTLSPFLPSSDPNPGLSARKVRSSETASRCFKRQDVLRGAVSGRDPGGDGQPPARGPGPPTLTAPRPVPFLLSQESQQNHDAPFIS